MDRAHRLGQTRQVTVYRMITRGTIEERIRHRAMQKEEVQKVVMTGGAGVDFNARSKENRTKDIAMWLVDDEEAAEIERKEAEMAKLEADRDVLSAKLRDRLKRGDFNLGRVGDERQRENLARRYVESADALRGFSSELKLLERARELAPEWQERWLG